MTSRLLDPRSRQLLRALIAQYIRDGEPVGSRTLAKHSGLDVSPATIRNVMADLEDVGLLATPHTSAGRVPTVQGCLVFVDSLRYRCKPMQTTEIDALRQRLSPELGTHGLLASSSEPLSMSQFVGMVTVPKRDQFALRHIEFVALDSHRVLVILVFADNEVQNRVIQTRRLYSPVELEQLRQLPQFAFCGPTAG